MTENPKYQPPRRRISSAVLAINPDIATGWALLDRTDGAILATSIWGTAELKQSLDSLIRQCFTSGVTLSVVQEPLDTRLFGPLGRKVQAVRDAVAEVVEQTYELPVTWISTADWKRSPAARSEIPWKFAGSPLLIHQKDAIRMGRCVIEREA